MSEEERNPSNKIQKFSSGISILQRIDVLWKDTHAHSRVGQYAKWNSDLDRIWLELSRDLNRPDEDEKNKETEDSEFKTKEKIFVEIESELQKVMPFIDGGLKGFKKPTKEFAENRKKQYNLLMKKQMFLARLENKLGKGTSWEETEDWD